MWAAHVTARLARGSYAPPRVPGASLRARPPQHFKEAAARRPFARLLVPRAAAHAHVAPQQLEVAAARRPFARLLVPRAAAHAHAAKHHSEEAAARRPFARLLVPRAAAHAHAAPQ